MMKFLIIRWKGVLAACIVAALCFSIIRFTNPVFFGLSIVIWSGVVVALFRQQFFDSTRWGHLALLCMSYIATILLMSLTEWMFVTRILIVLSAGSIGTFVSIIDGEDTHIPIYTKKAFRRMLVMGWVFVCGALFITTYAVSLFFPSIPMWVLFLIVGLYTSAISYAIWRMYYPLPIGTFSIWLLIMAVMNMELFWVMQLLPFGYIVLGFFSAWVWYVMHLMIRFHMSAEGIIWKKQRRFLIENGIVFILMLFIIRWI